MSSPSADGLFSNPELRSLYEIYKLPEPKTSLQDYFSGVMAILSEYFPISYSSLVLHDFRKDSLHVEALYGIGRDAHPQSCSCKKGVMVKVLQSRKPGAIQNLNQEPLYEEVIKGGTRVEKLPSPLLCIPLISDDEPIGVVNINSLYGPENEFPKDFQFLSILSAILTPVIRNYQLRKNPASQRTGKFRTKTSLLDEILEQKLTEVLNRIDPYVESKAKMSLLNDIIAVVEKILIKSALERMGHVQVAAAQFLGINRNTLRKKIKDLKIKAR